jgi:hypothetical protein
MSPRTGGRGGGVARSQPISTDVQMEPSKLWRSNSIFNLWLRVTSSQDEDRDSGLKIGEESTEEDGWTEYSGKDKTTTTIKNLASHKSLTLIN